MESPQVYCPQAKKRFFGRKIRQVHVVRIILGWYRLFAATTESYPSHPEKGDQQQQPASTRTIVDPLPRVRHVRIDHDIDGRFPDEVSLAVLCFPNVIGRSARLQGKTRRDERGRGEVSNLVGFASFVEGLPSLLTIFPAILAGNCIIQTTPSGDNYPLLWIWIRAKQDLPTVSGTRLTIMGNVPPAFTGLFMAQSSIPSL